MQIAPVNKLISQFGLALRASKYSSTQATRYSGTHIDNAILLSIDSIDTVVLIRDEIELNSRLVSMISNAKSPSRRKHRREISAKKKKKKYDISNLQIIAHEEDAISHAVLR